ncbi:MAG: endonuclease Q family protein [Caldicoprobacter oshimai]
MKEYFVDLHVHIGRSSDGKVVKRGTANDLTFANIAYEARYRKGINVIGVVDCVSPWIIKDIEYLLKKGELEELPEGGMIYRDDLVILLGSEIETREKGGCHAHSVVFFPYFSQVKEFSHIMEDYMPNLAENSTMSRLSGQQLFDITDSLGGFYMPAHAFTPHKSFYGNCTHSLHTVFDEDSFAKIPAIELGLSADTYMASLLSELDGKAFTSNSDAHSLIKMGREYNVMRLAALNYEEVLKALKGQDGRGIVANYGLDPKLGKYHRTFCLQCKEITDLPPPVLKCPNDPGHRVVVGVRDRIEVIKDRDDSPTDMKEQFAKRASSAKRPPYHYQVPLNFLPGVGPKTIDRLLDAFGTEMNILHRVEPEDLAKVVPQSIVDLIVKGREGRLAIAHGGGGIYGKVLD